MHFQTLSPHPQQSALTFLSQMPCLFQYHPFYFSVREKKKKGRGREKEKGKKNHKNRFKRKKKALMSKTVCSPVSQEKVAVILAQPGRLNSFPAGQLPGEVHFGVEQSLQIQQHVSPPGASCAQFSLAGDGALAETTQPQREQGSAPGCHPTPTEQRAERARPTWTPGQKETGSCEEGGRPWPAPRGTRPLSGHVP